MEAVDAPHVNDRFNVPVHLSVSIWAGVPCRNILIESRMIDKELPAIMNTIIRLMTRSTRTRPVK